MMYYLGVLQQNQTVKMTPQRFQGSKLLKATNLSDPGFSFKWTSLKTQTAPTPNTNAKATDLFTECEIRSIEMLGSIDAVISYH